MDPDALGDRHIGRVRLTLGVSTGTSGSTPRRWLPSASVGAGSPSLGAPRASERVAEHADMCSFEEVRAKTAGEVGQKLGVLRRLCEAVGRPYDSMIKSYLMNGVVLATTRKRLDAKIAALGPFFTTDARRNMGMPRDLIERLRPILARGIGYVVVNLTGYDDMETVELLARRVVPEVQGLAA
ncbi:MAG: hypothetical protein ACREI5_04800 [Candidatus Methylomirabilales bacterium]